jgi:hypothetical protein
MKKTLTLIKKLLPYLGISLIFGTIAAGFLYQAVISANIWNMIGCIFIAACFILGTYLAVEQGIINNKNKDDEK